MHAISVGDDQMLSKVNGIGKKKAEQIIVQLKHKVATLLESGTIDMSDLKESSHFHDVELSSRIIQLFPSRNRPRNGLFKKEYKNR